VQGKREENEKKIRKEDFVTRRKVSEEGGGLKCCENSLHPKGKKRRGDSKKNGFKEKVRESAIVSRAEFVLEPFVRVILN